MDTDAVDRDLSTLLQSANGCQYTDIQDGVIEVAKVTDGHMINILHLNIRSFSKNKDNLVMLLSDLQERGIIIHAIGLCETFLTDTTKDLAFLENYEEVHRCHEGKPGGGTSIFIHDSLKLLENIDTPFNANIESTTIIVEYRKHKILVSEIYRPPNTDYVSFLEGMKIVFRISDRFNLNFICCDQNLDLLKLHAHKWTNDYFAYLLENEFVPSVTKPTRIMHRSSTLIDNIFVRSKTLQTNLSYIIVDGMSDHYPCLLLYATIKKTCKSSENIVIQKRKLTDDVILQIQQDLLFHDWGAINMMAVDESYEYLIKMITLAKDRYAPVKNVRLKADNRFWEGWLMVQLKKYNQKARKLCIKVKDSGLETDFN